MRIGAYELFPIETGRFWLDGGAMFGVVPKTMWSKSNPADALNRVELVSRCLLIRGAGRTILVDCGSGNKFSEKQKAIYGLDNSREDLWKSLAAVGVTPDQVTDVVLTHLHFDHVGGATVQENGVLRPTFPQARYHVQRAQWAHAQRPSERDRASYMPENYMPIQEQGLLNLIDGETELLPGISMLVVQGHTPGQQLPKISDGKKTLLFCADLAPVTTNVRSPYIPAYDLRPLETLEEKKRILGQACAENWTLFFEHDPQVVAGRLKSSEKGIVFDCAVAWNS